MNHPTMPAALGLVLLATLGLAFKGILARLAYAAGISVEMLLVLRFALAVPLFWTVGWLLRQAGPSLGARDWLRCMATGGLFCVSAYCDFTAIHLAGAALSRIVLFTFPALLILIQALRKRSLPPARQLTAFAIAYGGLLLVVLPGLQPEAAVDPRGLWYAAGAAISYALFLEATQDLTRRIGSVRFNVISNTATAAIMLALLVPGLEAADYAFSATAFGWVVAIVLVSTVLPYFLLYEGIRRCGASQAGVVTLLGPAVTVLAAWLILGERLTAMQWTGFAVVTLAMGVLKGLVRWPRRAAAGAATQEPRSSATG